MSKWKPEVGEIYFIPSLAFFKAEWFVHEWAGGPIEENWYKAGFVCRTREEALELAKKMLAAAKESVGR